MLTLSTPPSKRSVPSCYVRRMCVFSSQKWPALRTHNAAFVSIAHAGTGVVYGTTLPAPTEPKSIVSYRIRTFWVHSVHSVLSIYSNDCRRGYFCRMYLLICACRSISVTPRLPPALMRTLVQHTAYLKPAISPRRILAKKRSSSAHEIVYSDWFRRGHNIFVDSLLDEGTPVLHTPPALLLHV